MKTTNLIATILIWLGLILVILIENPLIDALIFGFQLGVLVFQIAYNIFDC